MKTQTGILTIVLSISLCFATVLTAFGKAGGQTSNMSPTGDVETFIDRMKALRDAADNDLFALHFQSMIDVIEARGSLTSTEINFISSTLPVFTDNFQPGYAADNNSYLDRIRPLTIAWVSPTDGEVSFFRMKLPYDWDQEKTYPLYIDLHGLTGKADNPIEYLTNYYREAPSATFAYEDGYHISPWGRGNFWYQGISETDIFEAIDVAENLLKIDQSRKYLVGHSMGGYGTWTLASKTAYVWAAIGIHAGALWYGNSEMVSDEVIQKLIDVPAYFVCGTSDGLYDINLRTSEKLADAGNQNVEFVSFAGGHEKLAPNVENMYLWLREFVNEDFIDATTFKKADRNKIVISPNTIQSETTICINLEKPARVQLNLYNLDGKRVASILNKHLAKGETTIVWNRGVLRSGIYTYSLSFDQQKMNGKLVLN